MKFGGLEPQRYEDIKAIVAPETDPKSFETFEKRAPGRLSMVRISCCFENTRHSTQTKEKSLNETKRASTKNMNERIYCAL